jgi:hypothetical protein
MDFNNPPTFFVNLKGNFCQWPKSALIGKTSLQFSVDKAFNNELVEK